MNQMCAKCFPSVQLSSICRSEPSKHNSVCYIFKKSAHLKLHGGGNFFTFWCLDPLRWAAYASAPVHVTSHNSQRYAFAGSDSLSFCLAAASFFLCFWPSRCSLYVWGNEGFPRMITDHTDWQNLPFQDEHVHNDSRLRSKHFPLKQCQCMQCKFSIFGLARVGASAKFPWGGRRRKCFLLLLPHAKIFALFPILKRPKIKQLYCIDGKRLLHRLQWFTYIQRSHLKGNITSFSRHSLMHPMEKANQV